MLRRDGGISQKGWNNIQTKWRDCETIGSGEREGLARCGGKVGAMDCKDYRIRDAAGEKS